MNEMMTSSGMFVIKSSLRWVYYPDCGLQISYTVAAFGHWQICMLIKKPAALLDALKRVEGEDQVRQGGLEVSKEDDMITIMSQRGSKAVVIDLMDMHRLIEWLSGLEA